MWEVVRGGKGRRVGRVSGWDVAEGILKGGDEVGRRLRRMGECIIDIKLMTLSR